MRTFKTSSRRTITSLCCEPILSCWAHAWMSVLGTLRALHHSIYREALLPLHLGFISLAFWILSFVKMNEERHESDISVSETHNIKERYWMYFHWGLTIFVRKCQWFSIFCAKALKNAKCTSVDLVLRPLSSFQLRECLVLGRPPLGERLAEKDSRQSLARSAKCLVHSFSINQVLLVVVWHLPKDVTTLGRGSYKIEGPRINHKSRESVGLVVSRVSFVHLFGQLNVVRQVVFWFDLWSSTCGRCL